MNFASDNAAGVAPEIMGAITRANEGAALAYGRDPWTVSVERRFAQVFEREVAVFLVATGTAANALALAHLTPPWGARCCATRKRISRPTNAARPNSSAAASS
jgi:threonine aldolase